MVKKNRELENNQQVLYALGKHTDPEINYELTLSAKSIQY